MEMKVMSCSWYISSVLFKFLMFSHLDFKMSEVENVFMRG